MKILYSLGLRSFSASLSRLVAFALLLLGAGLVLVQPCAAAPFVFNDTGSLHVAREFHTATLLANGRVLVAGGDNGAALLTAELYDPANGTWAVTAGLLAARYGHTATLLPNGKVLVAGGFGSSNSPLASAELYDPASGTWVATGSLAVARYYHTATLLPNGKVLVTAGEGSGRPLVSAELYDPASGTWTATGSLSFARYLHTATLLPNGKVLVAGGYNDNISRASAQLYDPASGTWAAATGNLGTSRYLHTAMLLPNGKVLVAGGLNSMTGLLASAELYDPASETWTATGDLASMRDRHTATLLPNGKVLVAGGFGSSGALASAELYDSSSGTWVTTSSLAHLRYFHTATLLPNGEVLVAGGFGSSYLASAELYDSANGTWSATGDLGAARYSHTATLLPNGKVLAAGGFATGATGGYLASAELYDPASATWAATGSMSAARNSHTATLLPNGKVLVAGGRNANGASGLLASAELYDPASGTWTVTGSLGVARELHTATLLPNGKVLVAGGFNGNASVTSAELYDPASGTWTPTGSLGAARSYAEATLLPNGKVLVAGGGNGGSPLASAELYDPASGTWATTGSLIAARQWHTATLLPSGKVLVAAGFGSSGALTSAELYDPASGTWASADPLTDARYLHTATLLPNGKVLVAAGFKLGGTSQLTSAELYDPANGTNGVWTTTDSLAAARSHHTATLLLNGRVLIAGGDNSGSLASVERYAVGLGFSNAWQPEITLASNTIQPGVGLSLNGSRFQGISQASGGNFQDSSSNYPIVQLRSLENSQVVFLPVNPTYGWSDTFFISGYVSGFPFGPALVSVFTNGIRSDAKYLVVAPRSPFIPTQASATTPVGGSISDTATLQNAATPTGTITFRLFGPDDATCGAAAVFVSTKNVTGAGGYTSDLFVPTAPGTYRWVATYSGDANNNPAAGACNATNESVVVTPGPTPVTTLANISTRLRVETGDNVLIGGFIITGTDPKKVMVRGIGPSLAQFFPDFLADPTLELHDGSGATLATNDNWKIRSDGSSQQAEIEATTIPPTNDFESAIVATLPANNSGYTAIVRGVNNGTGIGVVEAYDLDTTVDSRLANISTRGFVQTGDNVLIAGTIIVGQGSQNVIVRALGPSVSVPGAMADPTLELRDSNGSLLEANDNWVDSPNKQAIIDSTIPPTNDLESAIVRTLSPASYTAVVRGANDTTGIAVVEVYALN